jgi:hypothetical protein
MDHIRKVLVVRLEVRNAFEVIGQRRNIWMRQEIIEKVLEGWTEFSLVPQAILNRVILKIQTVEDVFDETPKRLHSRSPHPDGN